MTAPEDRCSVCGMGECECVVCPSCGARGTYDDPPLCGAVRHEWTGEQR